MSDGFPWQAAMAFGFGRLRLSPAAFWAMTPRELVAALGPLPAPPERATFERLAALYPDRTR